MVTSNATTEVLSSGLVTEQIKNLKRRQRARYYRRITVTGGEMVWVRTELLPADVEGQAYYRSKGFRLDPPEGTEWDLNNTARQEEKEKLKAIDAEKDALLQSQSDMLQKLSAEIASLKANLADKGTQEHQSKMGRPRKTGG